MVDTPQLLKPGSSVPYILVAAVCLACGVALILGILFLRPQVDMLSVIGAVGGLASLLFGLAANFMKVQETHLTVNSQATEARAEIEARAHAQGVLDGIAQEQARVAKKELIAAATSVAPIVPIAVSVPPTPKP